MVQPAEGLGLPLEALQPERVSRRRGLEDLDGGFVPGRLVPREPDATHGALAEQLQQPVPARENIALPG